MTASAGRALSAIVSELEEDIVFGRLHPRERLVEEVLTERFAAKRHVVRQALVELERMGLIERHRNRGAVVKAYTPEEVQQLYVVREMLETGAARLIPLPLPADRIAALEAIQRAHDSAVAAEDMHGVFRANIAFHRALFSACDNPYLASAIEEFAQKTHAIRFYSVVKHTLLIKARDDHRAIIEALRAGDRNRLIELCRDHLLPSKQSYIAAYRQRFTPVE
ncbi:GntR family transcriptional regulator [Oceanibaculum pacificum]|uniref:GntR family transcriptional regulator n=1 Tax=Oceanibaculum pacificum TaxID=580166 RepID=A0A154VC15_9PROT|nr:GntR family transcriptional regulator [Oceanibaculum pacificum]KZC98809.1 GntR family transcriptional regulator [Oceanibaculum pacificum]